MFRRVGSRAERRITLVHDVLLRAHAAHLSVSYEVSISERAEALSNRCSKSYFTHLNADAFRRGDRRILVSTEVLQFDLNAEAFRPRRALVEHP